MDKTLIYQPFLAELKKINAWCKNPTSKEDFDIDIVFEAVLSKNNLSMGYGLLSEIFSLTDTLCDCIRHNQPEVKTGYSISKAIEDLEYIIQLIESSRFDELENNSALKKQLGSLYS